MATINEIIRLKIEEIIKLINEYNSTWATIFKNYLYEMPKNGSLSDFTRDILKVYQGGMGSFTDLVLQRNGKMPIEDNEKLEKLKKELYDICKEYDNRGLKD